MEKNEKDLLQIRNDAIANAIACAAENDKVRFEKGVQYYLDNTAEDINKESGVLAEAIKIAANDDVKLIDEATQMFCDLMENPTISEPEESEAQATDETDESEEQSEEESETESERKPMKTAAKVILFIFICVVIGLAIGFAMQNDDAAKVSTSAPVTLQNQAFKQETDLNENNRVDTKFAAAIADAQEKINSGSNDGSALRDAIMERAGHNAHALAIYANKIGGKDMWADPNDWKGLVSDGYLSKDGEKLYYQLEGAMKQSGVQIILGEASANGYNSGIDSDGTFGAASNPGITGDTTAVIVTTPDNSSTTIMKRCGNIVYQSEPGLPIVPTDDDGGWIGPGTPDPEPKDPEADVLDNSDVADWKKNDNGEEMEIDSHDKKDNGATVANGLQKDPEEDADDAEDAAIDAAEEQEDFYDDAVDAAKTSGAGVVETKKSLNEVEDPKAIDSNW